MSNVFNCTNSTLVIAKENTIKSRINILHKKNMTYIPKNNGEHITIFHADSIIEYWPITCIWKIRNSPTEGKGLYKLLKLLGIP